MVISAYLKIAFEIALLWYFIYLLLVFIRGTRTEQLLKGVVIIVTIFIITQQLRLEAINWVMTRLFPISVIALLVIFQPELRRGLARLGQFGVYQDDIEAIEEIVKAVDSMASKRVGALIVIEREVGLKTYIESGTPIDSKVTEELLSTIFMPKSPLHDGAVIIQRDRILAAACLLPLSEEKGLSKTMGTRHRAAIGLSEETDAICIVVSEETGSISLSIGGRITTNLEVEGLTKTLKGLFYKKGMTKGFHKKIVSRISPKVSEKGHL